MKAFGKVVVMSLVGLVYAESTTPKVVPTNYLLPIPQKITWGEGRLTLDSKFKIAFKGFRNAALERAARRLLDRLEEWTGVTLSRDLAQGPSSTLVIDCAAEGQAIQSPTEDESYSLNVLPSGIELKAKSSVGVYRGLETIAQLAILGKEGFEFQECRIEDRPQFVWRGLLVDSSRHFHPVETIRRILDSMAAVKLNVLHFHLTDDQGFRVESKRYPKLHELGSDGKYYTQEELKDLVAFAKDRGIRIVPEFDMPGHSTPFFVAYPELASGPGPYGLGRRWIWYDGCFDPTRETTYEFINNFVAEMTSIFPDEYWHIGGDEVNPKEWTANKKIQEYMRQNGMKGLHDLQVYFNKRCCGILKNHKRKMVGWDEIRHPDLPKDIVVQAWRNKESLIRSAQEGNQAILSFGFYLDHMQPASFHYKNDPLKGTTRLSDEQKANILGGEACMWAESVSWENIESRIWPRTGAVAERLWSSSEVKDPQDMYRRLYTLARKMGWLHSTRPMLRRMAPDQPTEPLEDLAGVLEACATRVGVTLTSLAPLNRMADIAAPESHAAWEFDQALQAALAGDPQKKAHVRLILSRWKESSTLLQPIIRDNPLLKEIEGFSKDLSALGELGLETLDCLESGKIPDSSWFSDRRAIIQRAAKPRHEMRLALATPMTRLLGVLEQSSREH